MHPCYLECLWVRFPLLFFTHKLCLRHLWIMAIHRPLFLDTFSLCTSSLNNGDSSSLFFFFFFLNIQSEYVITVSPWIFLFSSAFVEFILSYTLIMVPSILGVGQHRYSSFWLDFCIVVWFSVTFSFSWSFHFNFFLSPLFWWCPYPIIQRICKFPLLQAFRYFVD